MTTHAGTGLFCRVRFIKRFFRDVFFRAAIYERRIPFFRFLSVGVSALMLKRNQHGLMIPEPQSITL
jgi:hypothetical protein